MIKNIVFDIGNVLADYRLKDFLAEKGFDAVMIKRILKASIMSSYWEAFERSELTEEEAMKAFQSLDPEIAEEITKAYTNIEGMITKRAFAIPLIQKFKDDGYHVFYLSNYSRKAFEECKDSVEFMKYTDGGMLSFQVGMTKPDPSMYQNFLKEYHLDAQECVFVDDTEQNVVEAKKQGFEGIVFTTYEEMMEQLGELGVII